MSTAFAALVLGATAVGCATEEPEDKPYVPQITHSPQDPADDKNVVEGEGTEPEIAEDAEGGGNELEPPEIPDAIYENTLEGAEAAARYYLQAFEYAFSALDPDLLREICLDASEACTSHIANVEDLRSQGHQQQGGEMSWLKTESVKGYDDRAIISATLEQEAFDVIDAEGQVLENKNAVELYTQFLLIYTDGEWKVRAISNEDRP